MAINKESKIEKNGNKPFGYYQGSIDMIIRNGSGVNDDEKQSLVYCKKSEGCEKPETDRS
ncbi:20470_t:CDS:2 [Dentiscutata erythropus]|uniref:20470_t:CDS:1 n=1 Tax=Dentiscutata erythropus TaxID=1348616 RepID=A0A9N9APP5_9GLOM|nr:20470_t:CDS:2 [Dentiscutata erythropus]